METLKHRDGTAERRQQLFREAVAVIVRDYSRDLQIDDVGRAVAASRRQLQRVFAEVGGTSFRELLQAKRMTEARRLLERDGVRIQEVAAAVGYHQAAQFTKAFRREFGVAPREFRKRARRSRSAHEDQRLMVNFAFRGFDLLPVEEILSRSGVAAA